ncbi:MAG: sugar ABC transporter ATP-binding protein [Clostridia bacterium]
MGDLILKMEHIHKRFPGVYALKDINLDLYEGEVLGLLGENGAGKSTLMKILSGVYQKDEGKIRVDGREVQITDVKKAHQYGISIIHQELMLVPYMTIYENVFLGREIYTTSGLVNEKRMREKTQALLDRFELGLYATQKADALTIAQQQMVEIIRAVSFNARIVVMDEPTSSLSDNEVHKLFEIIAMLKKEKVGVVYISHRLAELFQVTDRITVLRDGQYIGTRTTKETTSDELVALMVGRTLSNYFTKTPTTFGDVILEVKGLSSPGHFENVNFHLRKNEILGFAGLVGAGRSEVMKTIFGLLSRSAGEIYIAGEQVVIQRPRDAIRLGLGLVPENRRDEGLVIGNTVAFNMTMSVLREFIHAGYYDHKREWEIVRRGISRLKVSTPSVKQRVGNLSGGNQQKVVVAKWLAANPRILIMDEPTRGIDVGAKAEIYAIMNDLAKNGVSIIMISSELPEVINMSDRVMIMSAGHIVGELSGEMLTQENIMRFATGGDVKQ